MNSKALSNPFGIREMPEISYIICASQRSGSSLLCEALWLTDLAGRPEEYFLYWYMAAREPERLKNDFVKPWLIPPAAYMRKLLQEGTTSNRVFGVKIMGDYFDIVIDKLRTFPQYQDLHASEILDSAFPNLHYIYMIRKDKVRQAVSMAKAMQSDKWYDLEQWLWDEKPDYFIKHIDEIRFNMKNVCEDNLEYNFDQIALFYRIFQEQDRAWETYFNKLRAKPYKVIYEQFVDFYEETALAILDYLKVPQRPDRIVFQKRFLRSQNDSINEEWVQRFIEDLAKQTP